MVLTPDDGDAAITSWPCSRRFFTTFFPISPLPPMTTIFMLFSCPHAGLKRVTSVTWLESKPEHLVFSSGPRRTSPVCYRSRCGPRYERHSGLHRMFHRL